MCLNYLGKYLNSITSHQSHSSPSSNKYSRGYGTRYVTAPSVMSEWEGVRDRVQCERVEENYSRREKRKT